MQPINKVILSHYKGGVGKTTTAMNLGRALQLLGQDVVIVDIDDATQSALNWYRNWVTSHPGGEPAPLPNVVSMVGDVRTSINKLAQNHDLVLIDAGAGIPIQNQTAVQVADLLLVPVGTSHLEIQPTIKYLSEIAAAQARFGRPEARTILNRAQSNRASAAETATILANPRIPVKPMGQIVPARESLTKMMSLGVSVYDYPRSNDLREIFTAMAKETLKILEQLRSATRAAETA